jgi:ABC-type multidrug transport system ATPase subunit
VNDDSELVICGYDSVEVYEARENGLPDYDGNILTHECLRSLAEYFEPDEEFDIQTAGVTKSRFPGGEKRLVGLAGVLVLEPSVIVLDEPLAGLDPERPRLVADRIEQIHEDGISVVLSTHDLEFAAEVADRACLMADGNVVGSGTPREVFYDDELLAKANLHPPSAVRVARDGGLVATAQPVTEADLVSLLTEANDLEPPQMPAPHGSGHD